MTVEMLKSEQLTHGWNSCTHVAQLGLFCRHIPGAWVKLTPCPSFHKCKASSCWTSMANEDDANLSRDASAHNLE